jgi:uncharacterized circularly permuted ATP-grasp superfamily protein
MPGKWGLHTFYARDPRVARYLPETRLLTRLSLRAMLNRYGSVYVKPNLEHMGKGVMKVWKNAEGYRAVKVKGQARPMPTMEAIVPHVMRLAGGKPHIVQRTIPLATLGGRAYDIRVMMMRDGTDKWRYSGMLAKVAGPTSIITNVLRGGGYATTVPHALRRSVPLDGTARQRLERQLVDVSYDICRRFNRYKYSSQIGIDYGVDRSGKLWVIEVNYDFPSHALFARLSDKTMYRLIKRRHAEYKRSRLRVKKRSR